MILELPTSHILLFRPRLLTVALEVGDMTMNLQCPWAQECNFTVNLYGCILRGHLSILGLVFGEKYIPEVCGQSLIQSQHDTNTCEIFRRTTLSLKLLSRSENISVLHMTGFGLHS